jgi:acyl transferase domain-containing protein
MADGEIAIVGMAGRFPGAPTLERFWQNLAGGVESISFFADAELESSPLLPMPLDAPNLVKAGGVLDDVESFDAARFGFSPREAEATDPQQRVFLECAAEALERAGIDPRRFPGSVGVYAGASMNTYLFQLLLAPGYLAAASFLETVIGNDKDYLATRVAYKLDLRGPSMTVQTACSTSLVAVHLACQALLAGECDVALAGGVSIRVPQRTGYLHQPGGPLSPDGRCRAFDARAAGTVLGAGAAAVVLKPLAEALADGDHVHAVVRGSAINNDGARKVGYTAPSADGQAAVIEAALAVAGVGADTIAYVEAHGTGTRLGDPIELTALARTFGPRPTGERCLVGSLKTNIGHLDAAAGVAGLVKTVLALEHGQIPPSLHCVEPTPEFDWSASPFAVATTLAPWPALGAPRRAGVSSFGIGGTNAHVVLEEAPARAPSGPARRWQVVPLSAGSAAALDAAGAELAAHLATEPAPLADVAHTLQVGRSARPWRRVVVAGDSAGASAALLDPARAPSGRAEGEAPAIVFMLPGGGSQRPGMARELYEAEPVFREAIDACAACLGDLDEPEVGAALRAGAAPLRPTGVALAALFAVEWALARVWQGWGVRPEAMIGHSLGEYVAACLAGTLALPDALALVLLRGRLLDRVARGATLAVAGAADGLDLPAGVSLAATNAPDGCVVSGSAGAIADFEAALVARGTRCQRLALDVAAHSPLADAVVPEFAAAVARLALRPPVLPWVSNVTGTWITPSEATDPAYWARHLRAPVRFADGMATLLAGPERLLLEVGPGQTLAALARRNGATAVVSSMRHAEDDRSEAAELAHALGALWLAGVEIDWGRVHEGERRRRVLLPPTPLDRRRHWPGATTPAALAVADPTPVRAADPTRWFSVPRWEESVLPPAPVRPDRAAPTTWLLYADAAGLHRALAARLEARGDEVVTVAPGGGFRALSERRFEVQPTAAEEHALVLRACVARGTPPAAILHLWSVGEESAAPAGTPALGFESLLALGQALASELPGAPVALTLVSTGLHDVTGTEPLSAEKATLLGPCRVLPIEQPNLRCRSVDVVLPPTGGPEESRLADALLAEADGASADETVALRGTRRWVQGWAPYPLDAPARPRWALRERGVYLVTGGLGGVGLALAGHLARRTRARLVLVGRTALPARETWDDWRASHAADDPVSARLAALARLEADGADVLALAADVTRPDEMRAAVAAARAHFGRLDGAIHAAGLPGGGLAQLKTRAAAAEVLAPKVAGTRVLAEVLAGESLDFLALCSSTVAVTGGVGMVDYCAANAFLDAFARHASRAGGPPVVSIGWDMWRGTGMAVALEAEHRALRGEDGLVRGLDAAEALDAFDRLPLAGGPAHVLVSSEDLATRAALARAFGPEAMASGMAGLPLHPRPALPTPFVAPRDDAEARVAAVWEECLGIDAIGVHDDFFLLGGHSLLATRVLCRLQESFGTGLTLRAFVQGATVAEVAAALAGREGEAADADVERALWDVEQMSDAEVAAELA